MSNLFKQATANIRNSNMVIFTFLLFVALLWIGLALGYEDYSTSRAGYESFPTRKVNSWVIPIVALLPQVGQVAFAFVFAQDTKKFWAILISALLFMFDFTSDVWFKTNGATVNTAGWGFAIMETLVLYTIGSEIAITVSLGVLTELLPDFLDKVRDGFEFALRFLQGDGKGDKSTPPPAGTPPSPMRQTQLSPMERER